MKHAYKYAIAFTLTRTLTHTQLLYPLRTCRLPRMRVPSAIQFQDSCAASGNRQRKDGRDPGNPTAHADRSGRNKKERKITWA